MGVMIDGQWTTDETLGSVDPSGEWKRAESTIRNWVTVDGSPGPTGDGGFDAASGRYHLYVAWNCPWAHRALLTRAIKGLEAAIPVSYAAPRRTDQGWVFTSDTEFADQLFGSAALHEIFARGTDNYTGRVTMPVLFDTQTGRMVSNESADVIRMLNGAFNAFAANPIDLYPEEVRSEIDEWNALIYATVNNGVYRAGFATSQDAYENAARGVFETLDQIERQLQKTLYLTGDQITEADVRLFPTLARFDVAYFGAFKCNLKRLIDYDHLWRYARRIYHMPGVAKTVRFEIYKRGYYSPSEKRNPYGIVPGGPEISWEIEEDN